MPSLESVKKQRSADAAVAAIFGTHDSLSSPLCTLDLSQRSSDVEGFASQGLWSPHLSSLPPYAFDSNGFEGHSAINDIQLALASDMLGRARQQATAPAERTVADDLIVKAEKGDVSAMERVAALYLPRAEGFNVDVELAFHWLERACDLESVWAMWVLGMLLLDGSWGRRDVPQAMLLLRSAAEKGSYLSKYHLGCVLSDGEYDVSVDLGEACRWFEKMLCGKSPWINDWFYHDARRRLDDIYRQMQNKFSS